MNILAHDTRYGPILYPDRDPFFRVALTKYGEWAWLEASLWDRLIAPGDVVVSGGVNCGAHLLHLAKLVGKTGAVFGFEPQLPLWQLAVANACLANVNGWVRLFHAALGATDGVIQVPSAEYNGPDTSFGGLSLLFTDVPDDAPRYPVRQVTVDSLKLTRCNLIQLDIEGMEDEALRGAQDTIAAHRPALYVEADYPATKLALFKRLERWHYRAYWHVVPFYNPTNYRGDAENVWPGSVVTSWLCVPEEDPADQMGLPAVTDPLHPPQFEV